MHIYYMGNKSKIFIYAEFRVLTNVLIPVLGAEGSSGKYNGPISLM